MPSEKKEQINFRVSPRFRHRIESECINRNMSLQDLITNALKFYFQTPTEDWTTADIVTYSDDEKRSVEERAARTTRWLKYQNEMPCEKVLVLDEVMKLDLLHYRSSRRKAALRKRTEEHKK